MGIAKGRWNVVGFWLVNQAFRMDFGGSGDRWSIEARRDFDMGNIGLCYPEKLRIMFTFARTG
jgi:hypothetical protein